MKLRSRSAFALRKWADFIDPLVYPSSTAMVLRIVCDSGQADQALKELSQTLAEMIRLSEACKQHKGL